MPGFWSFTNGLAISSLSSRVHSSVRISTGVVETFWRRTARRPAMAAFRSPNDQACSGRAPRRGLDADARAELAAERLARLDGPQIQSPGACDAAFEGPINAIGNGVRFDSSARKRFELAALHVGSTRPDDRVSTLTPWYSRQRDRRHKNCGPQEKVGSTPGAIS